MRHLARPPSLPEAIRRAPARPHTGPAPALPHGAGRTVAPAARARHARLGQRARSRQANKVKLALELREQASGLKVVPRRGVDPRGFARAATTRPARVLRSLEGAQRVSALTGKIQETHRNCSLVWTCVDHAGRLRNGRVASAMFIVAGKARRSGADVPCPPIWSSAQEQNVFVEALMPSPQGHARTCIAGGPVHQLLMRPRPDRWPRARNVIGLGTGGPCRRASAGHLPQPGRERDR
jgi:hypothetical protein